MHLLEAHRTGMAGFDRLVRVIPGDRWTAPTPCTEWSVRDLVNHLVYEQRWAPHLLRGETLADVGDRYDGDVLGDDPVGVWSTAAEAAREAFTAPEALDREVHVSGGTISAAEYCRQMTTDLAVHGWDLAVAIGEPHPIDDDLADTLITYAEPQVSTWQGVGIFAPPVPVDSGATSADRLVAMLGRRPG